MSATVDQKAFGCVANTIRLRSGRYFDFTDPQPNQFTLGDIAGALSKICRFGGQIEFFYSVAEHCIHCADQAAEDGLPLDLQLVCLMHDAAEAFTGDIVKPLKTMLDDFTAIEDRIEEAIWTKFGLTRESYDKVREIDNAMLIAERRAMFSPDSITWAGEHDVRTLSPIFRRWEPQFAEAFFVQRARGLGLSPIEG